MSVPFIVHHADMGRLRFVFRCGGYITAALMQTIYDDNGLPIYAGEWFTDVSHNFSFYR